jgi:hypothetical protein
MNKPSLIAFISTLVAIPLIAYATQVKVNIPTGITGPGSVPIGGMVAIMPSTHANAWQPPVSGAIKDGFMRADGGTVPTCSDCVIPAGTVLPNMTAKYPRGNTTSNLTGGGSNTQASNVTFASSPISTSGGAASFDKTVMNTNQTGGGHSHTMAHVHQSLYRDYISGIENQIVANSNRSTSTLSFDRLTLGSEYIVRSHPTTTTSIGGGYVYMTIAGTTNDIAFYTAGAINDAGAAASSGAAAVAWDSAAVSTTFTQPSFNQNTLTPTNNLVNNEPAYLEVIYVIRVK